VNCQANPNFKPFFARGDGNAVQYYACSPSCERFFLFVIVGC